MTLPTLVLLRQTIPEAQIDFNCKAEFHDLLDTFCQQWKVNLVDRSHQRYDAALFLQGELKDCWEVFLTRTPVRVGQYSKLFSFLLLNRGYRQRRSSNGKSEAESNLELAQALLGRLGFKSQTLRETLELPASEKSRVTARKEWDRLLLGNEKVVIFHPGMRGSALNVSVDTYIGLIDEMKRNGFYPILSVGPEKRDVELKREILQRKPDLKMVSGLKLSELAEFFRMARVVVAPSTGPLHLAHWVGAETIGLFSPVKSQHPTRWAPWGGKKKPKVLLPSVDCPATQQCLGEKCQYFNCMAKADWKGLLLAGDSV